MRLVLASRNAHKAREFGVLLAPHELVPLPADVELPPETGETFEAIAIVKARTAARATGYPPSATTRASRRLRSAAARACARRGTPASGATDGENLAKLLRDAPAGSPLAYVCALAYAAPDGTEHVVVGRCTGTLAAEPRGDGGFGYDPAFLPDDIADGRTMAELAPEEKDAISHRGRAARALQALLSAG